MYVYVYTLFQDRLKPCIIGAPCDGPDTREPSQAVQTLQKSPHFSPAGNSIPVYPGLPLPYLL